MSIPDYSETKWCKKCGEVRYLSSPNASYCVNCGSQVFLFRNDEEKKRFVMGAKRLAEMNARTRSKLSHIDL